MAPRTRASASATPSTATAEQPLELELMEDRPPAAQALQPVAAHELVAQPTPADMLMAAINRGDSLDKLEKLMDLRERWDANQAHREFNAAFAAFKAQAVVVLKSTLIKEGPLKGNRHANLADVVEAVTGKLASCGLAISWKLSKDEKDWMEVTCTLRHVGGHSETVSMGGAPDTGPGRNAIQARGSTKSYLERYTATAILGVAAREQDDDGAGGAQCISAEQVKELRAMFITYNVDEAKFLAYGRIQRIEDIRATSFDTVKAEIIAKKGPQRRSQQQAPVAANIDKRISAEQLRTFEQKMDRAGVLERAVLARYQLDSLEAMTVGDLARAEEWLAAMHP